MYYEFFMAKTRQQKLFAPGVGTLTGSSDTTHGGSLRKGTRKVARPFIRKRPIHIVLRSTKARGNLSFLKTKNDRKIAAILKKQASKHYVKILEWVNVGNHLHIKAKGFEKKSFGRFIRTIAALIAREVTGAKKGSRFGKFWDGLAYTRVLTTDFDERVLAKYFSANALESIFGKEVRDIFLGKVKFEMG